MGPMGQMGKLPGNPASRTFCLSVLSVPSVLFVLILLFLLSACAATQPLPPSTPPLPSVPPLPPPERERFVVTVTGTIRDARGQPVPHAIVNVSPADARCTPVGTAIGAYSDERGEFLAVIDAPAGTFYSGCAVVEATNGGARGTGSAPASFTSSTTHRQFARIDVTLGHPALLDVAEAERLVRLLADGINEPAGSAVGELAPFLAQGDEALRVALEQYRVVLGSVQEIRLADEEASSTHRRIAFDLVGANGRISRVDVHQEVLTRIHGTLLDYGMRSQTFMFAYVRAIASGDAVRLSQILNPDDIDFPVERAREMIVDYRLRYRDTATIQPEFVGIDEKRARIIWQLRGTGANGEELIERVELGYGDGLIGMRL